MMFIYLFAILFKLRFSESATAAQDCTNPDVKNGYFVTSPTDMTETAAATYCTSIGGSLPFFATATELSNFNSYQNIGANKMVWLDYHNSLPHSQASPGTWSSTTGVVGSVFNWDANQPDNANSNEFCTASEKARTWHWADEDCATVASVICVCPNTTTTTTTTSVTTTTSTTTPTTTTSTTTPTTTTSTTTPTTTTSTTTTTPTTTTTTTPTTTTSTTPTTTTSTTSTVALTPTTTSSTTTSTGTTTPTVATTSTTSTTTSTPIITTVAVATTGILSSTSTTSTTIVTTSTTTISLSSGYTPTIASVTTSTATTNAALTTTVSSNSVSSGQPTLICPCSNGGVCNNLKSGDTSCTCVGNWELGNDQLCSKYGFPKDAAGVASFIAQMTGCTAVVVLLSITVGTYILVRDRSAQSILVLLSDTCILVAHVLIYTCRSPFIADLSDLSCRLVSFFVQFFALCHFDFLLLQSLHAYSLVTNVNTSGWWPLPILATIFIGLFVPAVVMAISAALHFHEYNLAWDCLVNFNSMSRWYFIAPTAVMGILVMIISEAAGMDSTRQKRLVITSKSDWLSAQLGQRSSAIVYIFSALAFVFTSLAVFHLNVYLSTVAFALNITFAIFIFFFHCLENPKIRHILKKGWAFVNKPSPNYGTKLDWKG